MARRKRSASAWRVERQLIRHVYESPDITRQELAVRLGQSPAAVSLIIRRLIGSGWLRESGRAVSLGGRRPVQLRLSAHKALIVGQSVTDGGVRSVVVNPSGEVIAEHSDETCAGGDVGERVRESFDAVVRRAKVKDEQLIGAGLALSGTLARGLRAGKKRAVADALVERLAGKVLVADDGALARLTWELHRNPSLRTQTVLLIDLGCEIGSALSVMGAFYRGWGGATLDVRFIPVSPSGRGGTRELPLSDAVSLDRLLDRARAGMATGEGSLLWDIPEGDPQRMTALVLARAAQAGDACAYRIVNDASEAVGQAIGMLVNILRPRTVLLAGELVTSGALVMDEVHRTARLTADPAAFDELRVVASEADEWAAAKGIADLVLRDWLDSPEPMGDATDDQP